MGTSGPSLHRESTDILQRYIVGYIFRTAAFRGLEEFCFFEG